MRPFLIQAAVIHIFGEIIAPLLRWRVEMVKCIMEASGRTASLSIVFCMQIRLRRKRSTPLCEAMKAQHVLCRVRAVSLVTFYQLPNHWNELVTPHVEIRNGEI